jgi:hypothetical protein
MHIAYAQKRKNIVETSRKKVKHIFVNIGQYQFEYIKVKH